MAPSRAQMLLRPVSRNKKSFARARATVPLRPSRRPSSRGQLPVRHPWLPSGGTRLALHPASRTPQATGWPPALSNLSVHQAHPVHDAHDERPTAAAPRTPQTAGDHNEWRRIPRSDGSEDGVPTWAILSQHAATHTDGPTAPSHRWETLRLLPEDGDNTTRPHDGHTDRRATRGRRGKRRTHPGHSDHTRRTGRREARTSRRRRIQRRRRRQRAHAARRGVARRESAACSLGVAALLLTVAATHRAPWPRREPARAPPRTQGTPPPFQRLEPKVHRGHSRPATAGGPGAEVSDPPQHRPAHTLPQFYTMTRLAALGFLITHAAWNALMKALHGNGPPAKRAKPSPPPPPHPGIPPDGERVAIWWAGFVKAYNEDQEPRLATLSSSSAPDGEWLT